MPVITPLFDIRIKGSDATYRIPAVKRIKIYSSRDITPDRALVSLPMMSGLDLNTFKKDDEVTIQLGHKEDSSLKTMFLGYITKISPNLPVEIECKDVWSRVMLRKRSSEKNYKSQKFTAIAEDLISDISDIDGIGILTKNKDNSESLVMDDNFHVDKQSYQRVFEYLTQSSGWDFYVIPGTKTFYFGPGLYRYEHKEQTETPILRRGLNIIRSHFKWIEGGDYDKVIVFTADKEFKTRKKDLTGEYTRSGVTNPQKVKERFIPGVNKEKLNIRAREEFEKLNNFGFEGRFTTFGQSRVMHSVKSVIEGVDHRHPEEIVYPEKVVYDFAPYVGFKMEVYLGTDVVAESV